MKVVLVASVVVVKVECGLIGSLVRSWYLSPGYLKQPAQARLLMPRKRMGKDVVHTNNS